MTPAEVEVKSQLSSGIALPGFRAQLTTQPNHYQAKRRRFRCCRQPFLDTHKFRPSLEMGQGYKRSIPLLTPPRGPIPPPFAKLVPKACGAFSGAVPAANDVGDEVSVEHLELTALKVMAAFGWEG